MRRTLAALAAALGLVATLLASSASYAGDDSLSSSSDIQGPDRPDALTPRQVLRRAADTLAGDRAEPWRQEATLAMRDLFASLPRLGAQDRRQARALLARPAQGAKDPYGDGYRARAVRTCNRRVCVHRVRRTPDRATAAWAGRTLKVMGQVWAKEIDDLGYRRPLRDGRRGGDRRFDIYLADIGARGLYGYCAPELTAPGNRRLASGYCVLDNDFARSQFGSRPGNSLRVTAAHEFFHAIQFAYDYLEDPWLMEASATWVEERFADGVDDNRQYLRFGQVRRPWEPLDWFNELGANQYGNWAFFEYLSGRFGTGFVKRIWEQAGNAAGDGRKYSTRALVAALPRRQGFARVYAGFASANVTPDRSYPEGEYWPRPRLTRGASVSLGRNQAVSGSVRIDHLAAHHVRIRPLAELDGTGWRLRVAVDGPVRETAPVATVVRLTSAGEVTRTRLRLDRAGDGVATVPFSHAGTHEVWVVVGNASTRFDCRGPYALGYSCGGASKDDQRRFRVRFETVDQG